MNNILHIINEYDSLKAGLKYIINNSTSNGGGDDFTGIESPVVAQIIIHLLLSFPN